MGSAGADFGSFEFLPRKFQQDGAPAPVALVNMVTHPGVGGSSFSWSFTPAPTTS